MDEILNQLTEEQAQIALEVARKAKEKGIDPRLAVALAFQESRFKPDAVGAAGEIGLMQVRPTTAEMLGFSADDLKDPAKNIDIGLTYLKQGLDRHAGDPVLAVAGYNAGHDHPYFSDPDKYELPQSTKQYVRSIAGMGGFEATPAEVQQAQEDQGMPQPSVEVSDDDLKQQKLRAMADLAGVTGGALIGKGLDVASNLGSTGRAIREIPELMRSMPGAPTAAPTGAPTGGLGMRPPTPVAGGPAGPVGGPVGPLTQMGGPGAYNYGKAFGLTDIEAARATDMSKAPGGASDLIAKRSEALQKIQQMGGGFAENPRYGGIMTPQQGAGGGPRASFVQTPGGLSQLPPSKPIPTAPQAPARPSPLAQAGQMVKQGAGAVLRSPVTMGALGGLSIAEGGQEFQKRVQQGDTTGAALAGAQTVGGAMQIMPNPYLRGIGALISTASPLTQYLRDRIRNQPEMPEPTPKELELARRPAFVYPSP